MGALEWMIALAGVSVTVAVWAWFARGTRARADGSTEAQEVRVRVKGRYIPDRIIVEAGRPLRLTFFREETAPCSEGVVFPDFGRHLSLPAYREVVVELPPSSPGEHAFTCQLGMLRGSLVVLDKDDDLRENDRLAMAIHESERSAP